jgi:hypothetical protein
VSIVEKGAGAGILVHYAPAQHYFVVKGTRVLAYYDLAGDYLDVLLYDVLIVSRVFLI